MQSKTQFKGNHSSMSEKITKETKQNYYDT